MSEEKQNESAPGWKTAGWFIAWMAAVVLLGMAMVPPCASILIDKANQSATMGNCRQIVAALRLYAADHGGQFPDADPSGSATANQAFRVLIREGVLDDEQVFGAMSGMFNPDNNIGEAPDFREALAPGENHWAMTKGATVKSPPVMPLTFENAMSNGWPPKWNANAVRQKADGRAWKGGKIIVGFNDGSVELIQLESAKGTSVGPKKGADGKDVFTRAAESMQILDIER